MPSPSVSLVVPALNEERSVATLARAPSGLFETIAAASVD